ncbi:hypothetical protein LMG27952_07049 [Paraburkholderia hiiakae]|uniref:Avidin family protein n=1 Tax=Paraburkholderia hiiakae TaxID=1081782 RepID=A0ABM8P9T1_9BURK|nr:avidin/streptavidin family protein [Paraburkholderia hiiakae]CAD6560128.1 hypothetical protein LMG27952_07049 [Paraburkholderia hiiakae]
MTSNAQQMQHAPGLGTWRNQYGSLLEIAQHEADGRVSGTYRSETGATGTYPASGWIGEAHDGNRPFALAVQWRPLDSDVIDPGWHWVSVMAGVLYAGTHLQVLHGLVASGPFDAVELGEPGVYSETLTFDRMTGPVPAVRAAVPQVSSRSAVGMRGVQNGWIESMDYTYNEFGTVSGTLTTRDGAQLVLLGFTDPSPDRELQSVALTALERAPDGRMRAIGVGGFFDCHARQATLERFTARAVAHGNRYAGVSVARETLAVEFVERACSVT